jgi:hypothetical protein
MNADYTQRPEHAYNTQTLATGDEYNKIRQEAEPFKQDAVNTALRTGANMAMGGAQQALNTAPYALLGGGLARMGGPIGTVMSELGNKLNWWTGANKNMLGLNAVGGAMQGRSGGYHPGPAFDREQQQGVIPQVVHDIANNTNPVSAKDYETGRSTKPWSAGALANQMAGQGPWDPNSPVGERKDLPSGTEMINDYAMQGAPQSGEGMINDYAMQAGPKPPANPALQAPVTPVLAQTPQAPQQPAGPPEWASRFQPQLDRARRAGNRSEVRRLERMQAQAPESVQPDQRPDYTKWNNPSFANSGQTQTVGGQPQQMTAPPAPAMQAPQAMGQANQLQPSGQNAPAQGSAAPGESPAAPIPRPAPSNPGYEGLSADEVSAKARAETEASLNAPVMPGGMSQQGQEAWGAQQRMNRNRANREAVDNQLSGGGTRLMGPNGMPMTAPGGGYLPNRAGGSGRQLNPVLGRDGRPVLRPDGSPMIAAAQKPEPQYSLSPAQISMREAMRQKYERAEAMRRSGSPTYSAGGQPASPGQAPQMQQSQELMANNPALQAPQTAGVRKPDPSQDVAGGNMLGGTNPGPVIRTPGMTPQQAPQMAGSGSSDPRGKMMQQTSGTLSQPDGKPYRYGYGPDGRIMEPVAAYMQDSQMRRKAGLPEQDARLAMTPEYSQAWNKSMAQPSPATGASLNPSMNQMAMPKNIQQTHGTFSPPGSGGNQMANPVGAVPKSPALAAPKSPFQTKLSSEKQAINPITIGKGLWTGVKSLAPRLLRQGVSSVDDVAKGVAGSADDVARGAAGMTDDVAKGVMNTADDAARAAANNAGAARPLASPQVPSGYRGSVVPHGPAGSPEALAGLNAARAAGTSSMTTQALPKAIPGAAQASGYFRSGVGRAGGALRQGAGTVIRNAAPAAKAMAPYGPVAASAGMMGTGLYMANNMRNDTLSRADAMGNKFMDQGQAMGESFLDRGQQMMDQGKQYVDERMKELPGQVQNSVQEGIRGAFPGAYAMSQSPVMQGLGTMLQGGGLTDLIKGLWQNGKSNVLSDYNRLAPQIGLSPRYRDPVPPSIARDGGEPNATSAMLGQLLAQNQDKDDDTMKNFWGQFYPQGGGGGELSRASMA